MTPIRSCKCHLHLFVIFQVNKDSGWQKSPRPCLTGAVWWGHFNWNMTQDNKKEITKQLPCWLGQLGDIVSRVEINDTFGKRMEGRKSSTNYSEIYGKGRANWLTWGWHLGMSFEQGKNVFLLSVMSPRLSDTATSIIFLWNLKMRWRCP